MNLYVVNINFETEVSDEIPDVSTFKYNRETGEFETRGQVGQYVKNELVCMVAENKTDILDVIQKEMGRFGEDLELQILDVINLDNIVHPEQTLTDNDGNEVIIPAVKGRIIFQGGYDINKAQLKDLLNSASDLLIETGAI